MSDLFERVTSDQDIFKKILGKIPGFSGYIERSNRRASDKLLREFIVSRYKEQDQRIASIQRDLISQGGLEYMDNLEAVSLKFRQFTDRVRTASYGYSSLFEATKINEDELAKLYEYDVAMLDMVEEVKHAVDNLETSLGTDGLDAAIRHLTSLAQKCVEAFNRRSEIMMSDTPK